MSFSSNDLFFMCSSSRFTLHIYNLIENKNPVNLFEKVFSSFKNLSNNNYKTQRSDFSKIYFNYSVFFCILDNNKIIGITPTEFIICDFNSDKGGEGKIKNTIKLNYNN